MTDYQRFNDWGIIKVYDINDTTITAYKGVTYKGDCFKFAKVGDIWAVKMVDMVTLGATQEIYYAILLERPNET